MNARRVAARCLATLAEAGFAAAYHGLGLVPESVALRSARPVGTLLRIGAKRRVQETLGRVLGSDGPAGRSFPAFWRAHTRHVGLCVFESMYFVQMSDAELLQRVQVDGEEHLRDAFRSGRGAVLFLNHLGNPGAIVAGLGIRNHDVTMAGNRMDICIGGETVPLDRIERTVQRMFARGRMRRSLLGDALPRQLAETLARNGAFAMFVDFPVVRKHCRLIAFGAASMRVNLGPALLALRHRAPVLPVTCVREGRNRHRLRIHPPLQPPANAGLEEGARALMEQAMELLVGAVRANPDQWWPWVWADLNAP